MEEENNQVVNSVNVIEDFYQPILNQQKLYGDKRYNFFKENNLDTAELIGIERDANAAVVKINKDDPKNKEVNPLYAKDIYNFIADLPDQAMYRLVLGGMNGARLGVNLFPAFARLIGSEPGDDRFDDVYKFSQEADTNIKNKIEMFKNIYASAFKVEKGRDPNKASDLVSFVAQDYPYFAPIYSSLDKIGLPKAVSIPLSVGLSSGIAFDPKQQTEDGQSESSFFFDSASIKGLKKFFGALPDTPEGEIFDRAYQALETTGISAAIGPIINTALFLKRNVPAFNKAIPGSAVATGSATAIGEITDQTILNPKDETIENQEPTILDNISSGIDQFGNKLTQIGGAIKKEFSGEAMANPLIKKGATELAPVFKSTVVDAIEKIPNKAPGDQILGTIKNIPGVTQQEIKWIGLDDFLKGKQSVTKQEVSEFIEANKIGVVERKFTGEQKLPEKLLEKIELFKKNIAFKLGKTSQAEVEDALSSINYDTYSVSLGNEFGNMDFNTLSTILGRSPNIKKMVFKDDGFLKLNEQPSARMALEEADAKRMDTFAIDQLEFEKYIIENERRKFSKLNPSAKFERFSEPGGEDYTELVFVIDRKIGSNRARSDSMPIEVESYFNSDKIEKQQLSYRSPVAHFGTVGEFAHARFKTRNFNGQKILSVEELQSDLLNKIQEGLKTYTEDNVINFPFKNNWYEIVTKRLIRYAADNDFDAIAFQKGIVSAKRYDEIKKIDSVVIGSFDTNSRNIYLEASEKSNLIIADSFGYKAIREEYPTFAEQIIEVTSALDKTKGMTRQQAKEFLQDFNNQSIDFEIAIESTLENYYKNPTLGVQGAEMLPNRPITFGGEGKKEFYDKIVPNFLRKYGKKWNAPVYDDTIPNFTKDENPNIGMPPNMPVRKAIELREAKNPYTVLKITPEMKRSVQEKSQPLFNIVLPALSAGSGAKVISDSMENNTISNQTKN